MNGGEEINVNELLDTLDDMIPAQFDRLLVILDVPQNLMPSSDKPQTDRVTKLLEWAKAPGGCGLEKIKQTLEEMGIPLGKSEIQIKKLFLTDDDFLQYQVNFRLKYPKSLQAMIPRIFCLSTVDHILLRETNKCSQHHFFGIKFLIPSIIFSTIIFSVNSFKFSWIPNSYAKRHSSPFRVSSPLI